MQQDCQKDYKPNFINLCCLKHLIILNSLSEMRLLDSTFGKFLIKNLNNLDKNNKLTLTKEINLENFNTIFEYFIEIYFSLLFFGQKHIFKIFM